MTKRKKYSKEFKLDAISLVRDQNISVAEASRNLGVSAQMLGRWIKEEEKNKGSDSIDIAPSCPMIPFRSPVTPNLSRLTGPSRLFFNVSFKIIAT